MVFSYLVMYIPRPFEFQEFQGGEEKEDDEDSVARPEGPIEPVLSPPPMLRNLAKAANTVLTTIFGRYNDRPVRLLYIYYQTI